MLGLGYVGLPLMVSMAQAGIESTGFDVDPRRVAELRAGRSPIDDIDDRTLTSVASLVGFTAEIEDLRSRDVLFICVPTPLSPGKQPNLDYVEKAARSVASILRPGHTVIVESTTSPGTTQDVVAPILEAGGLTAGVDFLLAHSPERVDPGNASYGTRNITRIVGGTTPDATTAAAAIYGRFVEKIHAVRDSRTAEMTKLYENTFRWVNIALANEMATVARALDIDIWEVIDAAATKPFGFMPFYPGPGVGGHCIPLDPFYLQWSARLHGSGTHLIELADRINSQMPQEVVHLVQDALNERSKAIHGARVLALGVAYKANVRDYRESPALECIRHLEEAGAHVDYGDPHVPDLEGTDVDRTAVDLGGDLGGYDAAVLLCDHDDFDHARLLEALPIIVDTRNAFGRRGLRNPKIRSL